MAVLRYRRALCGWPGIGLDLGRFGSAGLVPWSSDPARSARDRSGARPYLALDIGYVRHAGRTLGRSLELGIGPQADYQVVDRLGQRLGTVGTVPAGGCSAADTAGHSNPWAVRHRRMDPRLGSTVACRALHRITRENLHLTAQGNWRTGTGVF